MLKDGALVILILASVYADPKDVNSNSTTQKTPAVDTRFFGLDGIFGGIFQGQNQNPAYGGQFQQMPYPAQQNPQQNNWANIQSPQQFPNQNQNYGQQFNSNRPSQSTNQGIFNPGNNFGSGPTQNFNTDGTLDDIPPQIGIQQSPFLQNGNQMGSQNQNGFQSQNSGNQMGIQNQNVGNQMGFQNQNSNQNGFQSQNGGNQMGIQNQNVGNQMGFPNQNGNQYGSQSQNGGNQMGFQNQNVGNQMGPQNQNVGNQMGFQNQNQQQDFGGNDGQVAILGRPVTVPTTSVPDSIVFQDGSDTPAQRQCVQDCQSTTDYDPVCASNNITYFNPGRFICARNCGLSVYLRHPGTCFE